MENVGWGNLGGGGLTSGPHPVTGMGSLGLYDASVRVFAAALRGMAALVVGVEIPSSSPAATEGRFLILLLLRLRFACEVEGDWGLPSIW